MFYRLFRNIQKYPEIGNTTVCVLPKVWRLGQVRNTKFGTNVSNKMLTNAKVRDFTVSELLRLLPPPTSPTTHTHTHTHTHTPTHTQIRVDAILFL